jgi:hypothetical protein
MVCAKTEIAPPQIYRITSETKMSITTTINNIAFTFELDADECWNIYAEHNFIDYVARDAKFTPLKTTNLAQIQELLKYDGQWEWFVAKNDKGVESRNIMLWWFVPLLDMKIIVQLEKKQTSVAEDVEVCFKMQEKQIAELQAEHKTELTKLRDEHSATVKKLVKDFSAEIVKLQSQFDRMTLRNKRMVIHFEMQGDKLKVSYEDKSPEATRAYNAYMEYILHMWISWRSNSININSNSCDYYKEVRTNCFVEIDEIPNISNIKNKYVSGGYDISIDILKWIKLCITKGYIPKIDVNTFICLLHKKKSPFVETVVRENSINENENIFSISILVNYYKHEYINSDAVWSYGNYENNPYDYTRFVRNNISLRSIIHQVPYLNMAEELVVSYHKCDSQGGKGLYYSSDVINILRTTDVRYAKLLYMTTKPWWVNNEMKDPKLYYIVIYTDRIMDK